MLENTTKKILIGAVHLLPTIGFEGFTNLKTITDKAIKDALAFQEGGMDAVIIENNYDLPHKIFVDPETIATVTYVVAEIKKKLSIPVGISMLWNDYKAGLAIAKVSSCSFIRIPVFVDTVKTSYGEVKGNAKDVIEYRKKLHAEEVKLLTDIHVKHATVLSNFTLCESAKFAIESGSDGIIVTGKWTGDVPDVRELQVLREYTGDFPLYIGSGATAENISSLLAYADGVIIGTSLKTGKNNKEHVNIRASKEEINMKKVISFVEKAKSI